MNAPAAIQDLVSQGKIARSVLVAQRGWTGWRPAAEVFAPLSTNGANAAERPLPPAHAAGSHQTILDPLRKHVRNLAGIEALESFSLRDMFSDVFQRRAPEELDASSSSAPVALRRTFRMYKAAGPNRGSSCACCCSWRSCTLRSPGPCSSFKTRTCSPAS